MRVQMLQLVSIREISILSRNILASDSQGLLKIMKRMQNNFSLPNGYDIITHGGKMIVGSIIATAT
jgi:hypothetical protein